jgi:hypothetical protein
MDNGNEPITVPQNIEDHIAIHEISLRKHAAQFRKVVPPDRNYNTDPRSNFDPRVRVALNRFAKMFASNEMHAIILLHNM